MEMYGHHLSPYEEGAKLSKTQQTPGKKKTKKKKKKKKCTQDDAEKQLYKSKKQPAFLSLPEPPDSTRTEDDATKEENAGGKTHQLFASTSNFSLLTEGHSNRSNESLRWDGILDDPVAEEERLWQYRLNRRKRYDASIHQSLPPEPSLTLKHLPQLFKVAHLNGDHLFCKTEFSSASQHAET